MSQEVSMKNTKKELLEIITKMQKEMSEKEKSALNPEKVKVETKNVESIREAEEIINSDLANKISNLKTAINHELSVLAEKIESEAKKFTTIQNSIAIKQAELENIYGIEEKAASLAVLIESQNYAQEKYEKEISTRRQELEQEINADRARWELEKSNKEKERQREEEEYNYSLKRSRAIEENSFADKIAELTKEIEEKKTSFEKQTADKTLLLEEREKKVAEREKAMDQLENTVNSFPAKLESAIADAAENKEKELKTQFTMERNLLSQKYEGEQKVLEAKIDALEFQVKDQAKQIDKLNSQQEKAYQQVQDIASRAVAGAAERPQSITVKTTEKGGNN